MARKIPTTVRDWELYSSTPGSGQAARDLTSALRRAMSFLKKEFRRLPSNPSMEQIGKLIGKAQATIMRPVMHQYSRFGASDSEPIYHSGQSLIDFTKDYYGLDGYVPELSDWL